MSNPQTSQPQFDMIGRRALLAGVLGGAALLAGGYFYHEQFYQSYLYGYIFWACLSLGCLGILMLHHLVSGAWGHIIQRMTEAGARVLPFMFLLFIPVLIGLRSLYPWTDHRIVEESQMLLRKEGYLNVTFFIVRTAVYFGLWILLAYWLTAKSREQDRTGDTTITRKMKLFSSGGIILFVLSATLASVDWLMSLEPEWYSTIYGMYIIIGMVLAGLAFCIILLRLLQAKKPFDGLLSTRHFHHIGNMLFAFTILWAYVAFSQFLIIWSGNLPEENFWYIRRLGSGWNIIAVVLLMGHFFVPFLLLLSRKRKRYIRTLARVAVLVFLMRFVDFFWLIKPAFGSQDWSIHWMDIVAPIAIGGIWVNLFIREFRNQPMIPLKDPRFTEHGFHVHEIE